MIHYREAPGSPECLVSGRTREFEAHFSMENALSSLLLTAASTECEAQTRPFENGIALGLGFGRDAEGFQWKDENFFCHLDQSKCYPVIQSKDPFVNVLRPGCPLLEKV